MAWFMERNIRRDEFVRSVVFVVALVAVFVMAALTFIPFNPSMPTSGLDPSWTLAMNQAVAAHLVFGRDVIFTFGPYASGYTTLYHPSTDTMMMFSATLLVISYCLALLYTIRTSTAWILFPIVIFLISYLNRDAFLITLPLAILFAADEIVWSRKDKLSPAARTLRASAVLVMVAALAMLPLIKGSLGLSRVWKSSLVELRTDGPTTKG
jgi:low affinity Fe/Cu permease